MSLREGVLRCARERLLNRSSQGEVFRTPDDHRRWLFDARGFLADPRGALAAAVAGAAGVHAGIDITGGEESEIVRRIKDMFRPAEGANVAGGFDGVALDTCDPTVDPYCEY